MRFHVARRWNSTLGNDMKAWMAERPGAPLELQTVPIPVVSKPNQVLLRVKATSINPIDTVMIEGYGKELLGKWKQIAACDPSQLRFPLIAGRDCCAVVESVGGDVHNLVPGDEVIAVVPGHYPGCHAEYVVTEASCCAPRPTNLDCAEAASLPYAASTAYSALVYFARMNPKKKPAERVLIHGGAGGVGSIAIQMLKAWGVEKVVTTCSKDSFELVSKLGAIPVDYRSDEAKDQLISLGPFEVVMDCVDSDLARWSDKIMGVWRNSVHVSIVSPLLRETDRLGLVSGLFSTASQHFQRSWEASVRGRWFTYAFFTPSSTCMQQLSRFASEGKIQPVIEKIHSFDEMPKAYEKVRKLHGRGKTVVKID